MSRATPVWWGMWLLLAAGSALAQPAATDTRETEQRLRAARQQLQQAAGARRAAERDRDAARRKLDDVETRIRAGDRALADIGQRLNTQQVRLTALQAEQTATQASLASQRRQLAALLRAADRSPPSAPLKVLLAQDTLAEGERLLYWQGYLQRAQAARIETLNGELTRLTALRAEIEQSQAQLATTRDEQRRTLTTVTAQRGERRELLDQLDADVQQRRARETAIGRDVAGLQRLLADLRAAAARAERERQATARAAADAARRGTPVVKPRSAVATIAPVHVGGPGWPLAGNLLAGFGARLPDGRVSEGVLIGAAKGSAVNAVADGSVVYADWMRGYGMLLIVDHGNGTMSLYANNDALLKPVGAKVRRGDALARVGDSGGQGAPALYFELRRNGQPVDPRVWLSRR